MTVLCAFLSQCNFHLAYVLTLSAIPIKRPSALESFYAIFADNITVRAARQNGIMGHAKMEPNKAS